MPDTKTDETVSVDSLVEGLAGKYRIASEILSSGKAPTESEIETLAFAVYWRTFEAVLNLDYRDSDCTGNSGCIDPFAQILGAATALGIVKEEGKFDYEFMALGRPAYWFGNENVIRADGYKHKDPVKPENEHTMIWRKREGIQPLPALVNAFGKEFGRYKPYLESNLRNMLGKEV